MEIPVRCYSCGKVVGNKLNCVLKTIKTEKTTVNDAFRKHGLRRYCCKRMLLGYIDISSKLLNYE